MSIEARTARSKAASLREGRHLCFELVMTILYRERRRGAKSGADGFFRGLRGQGG